MLKPLLLSSMLLISYQNTAIVRKDTLLKIRYCCLRFNRFFNVCVNVCVLSNCFSLGYLLTNNNKWIYFKLIKYGHISFSIRSKVLFFFLMQYMCVPPTHKYLDILKLVNLQSKAILERSIYSAHCMHM